MIWFLKNINTYRNEISERIIAETMYERKDNEQQKIIIFHAKAYITETDDLIILFVMNIKTTDDYALNCKI